MFFDRSEKLISKISTETAKAGKRTNKSIPSADGLVFDINRLDSDVATRLSEIDATVKLEFSGLVNVKDAKSVVAEKLSSLRNELNRASAGAEATSEFLQYIREHSEKFGAHPATRGLVFDAARKTTIQRKVGKVRNRLKEEVNRFQEILNSLETLEKSGHDEVWFESDHHDSSFLSN